MDSFLPKSDDPIVSILLLLGIIFIVSVLSYAYSIWKQEQHSKELLIFLKNFDSKECLLDTKNMKFEASMQKPLFLLALAYQKSGDYARAINLYLYLLKHTKDNSLLSHLALAYFRAGFLKRALNIYLEIVQKNPRDKEALYQIEFIYEKLNDFENAKDALDVLEALGEDVEPLRVHLKFLQINKILNNNERYKKLEELFLNVKDRYKGYILRELFKLNPKEAWSYFNIKYFDNLIDILNRLKKEDIDLDIISKHTPLKQLFFIKGYINECSSSSNIYALDLLSAAKRCGANLAQLKFNYLCTKCKNSYPLPFLRCPNCHRVYSFKTRVLIEKRREKSSYSLQ